MQQSPPQARHDTEQREASECPLCPKPWTDNCAHIDDVVIRIHHGTLGFYYTCKGSLEQEAQQTPPRTECIAQDNYYVGRSYERAEAAFDAAVMRLLREAE